MLPFFPPDFLIDTKRDAVIAWIKNLPVPHGTKKQMMLHWSEFVNMKMTRQDFIKAGAIPDEELSEDERSK